MSDSTKPEGAAEEVQHVDATPEEMEKFLTEDPRATIYAKSDAARFAGEQPEEAPAEEEEAAAPEDAPAADSEPAEESAVEEEDAISYQDFVAQHGSKKIRGKIDGQEVELTAAEWLKAGALTKTLYKRLEDVAHERKTLASPAQRPVQFDEPVAPVQPKPVRYWNDAEIRTRYNELAVTDPFEAQQFLASAQAEKSAAYQETETQRAAAALDHFKATYEVDENSPEWERMNDPDFYTKYPDILKARDSGDYFACLVSAFARVQQERANTAGSKIDQKAAAIQARTDAKKKGQVLRATSKPEPPPKPQAPKVESREEYIRRLQSQRRSIQGARDLPT